MARQLTGSTSNYLSSTLALNLPSDWTMLFRVKNVVSTGDHQIFFGRRGADTNGWAVGRDSTGGFFFWGFGGASGGSGTVATGSTGFDAYALTRSAAGTGTFYKNSTTALGATSITPGSSTGTGINLGNMNNAGTASFPANCELAEVAIFSRVLTSTELGQWFSGDSPSLYDTGLIHYWKLDAARASEPPSTVGETATVGGANLAEVGTVTSTSHPTMDYGSVAPTLVVNDGAHAHAADNLALTIIGTLTIADATHAHTADSIALTATSNGTITIPAVRDWGTKALKTGQTGVQVDIRNIATGALVVRKTGQTTHATTGVCVVTDAVIVAGTTYEVVTRFADGSRGMWDYTAL